MPIPKSKTEVKGQTVFVPGRLVAKLRRADPLRRKKVGPLLRELVSTDPRLDDPAPLSATPKRPVAAPAVPRERYEVAKSQSRRWSGTGNWGVSEADRQFFDEAEREKDVWLLLRDCEHNDVYLARWTAVRTSLVEMWHPERFWLLRAGDLAAVGAEGVTSC